MKRDWIIDDFSGGMNNKIDPRDLAKDEAEYLLGFVPDVPGQLRTIGKEVDQSKSNTNHNVITGSGLFHALVDRNIAGTEIETEWLMSADDGGVVDIFQYGSVGGAISGGAWGTLSPAMNLGGTTKGVFHSYDGVIRGCDAGFGGTPKYYGYIKRNKFTGAGGNAYQDDEFIAESTLLAPPPSFTFRDNDANYDTTLGALSTQVILFTAAIPGQPNYRWIKEFEGALSYVYDNNQESLLTVSAETVDNGSDVIRATMAFAISGTEAQIEAQLNKRITHAKFYMREVGTENWYLQGVYDFDKGGSLPGSDVKQDWGYDTTGTDLYFTVNTLSASSDDYMDEPLMEHTYISETGHSPNEKVIDIGNSGDGWKASVVLNRQVYLFGVKATDKDGIQIQNLDMILVSEPNQPDKFLRSNALISTTGDADHLVYGLGYNDALYAFKRKSMRVINVAQETYIDDTIMEGVDDVDKVVLTDYGAIWVNPNGLFLYGRNGFQELFKKRIEGKLEPFIDLDWFNTEVYGAGCGIAYNRYKQQIIISGYASGDEMIIYDLASGSVSYAIGRITKLSSNFVEDIVGNTLFLTNSGTTAVLFKFDFDEQAYSYAQYFTGEIDFGAPGVKKFIYSIRISYKNTIAEDLDDNILLYVDKTTHHRLVGTMDASTTTFKEAEYVMPSSAVYKECKSMQLKINGYDYNGGVVAKNTKISINHIIIKYRILPNAR